MPVGDTSIGKFQPGAGPETSLKVTALLCGVTWQFDVVATRWKALVKRIDVDCLEVIVSRVSLQAGVQGKSQIPVG